MRQITENIYVESERSICNSSFIKTLEGTIVIDTPMAPADAKDWAAEIKKHGEIKYVINGEPHPDHVAGNCYFGGKVVAHEGARTVMEQAKVDEIKNSLEKMAPDSLPLDPEYRIRPPEITFSEKLTLYLGNHTLHLTLLPGHTPYSIAVYVPEEKTLFTSDNINLGMPVCIDALPDAWLKSLERYQELDVDIVVPGHGEVTDKSAIKKMKDIVQSWLDVVGEAVKRGLNQEDAIEQVLQADMFSAMPKESPADFMLRMNIEKIYQHLKK